MLEVGDDLRGLRHGSHAQYVDVAAGGGAGGGDVRARVGANPTRQGVDERPGRVHPTGEVVARTVREEVEGVAQGEDPLESRNDQRTAEEADGVLHVGRLTDDVLSGGVLEYGIDHAERFGLRVHFRHEGRFLSGNLLGNGDRGGIGALQHQGQEQILEGDLLALLQAQLAGIRIGGHLAHRDHGVQGIPLEGDQGGHGPIQRGQSDGKGRVLLEKSNAAGEVDDQHGRGLYGDRQGHREGSLGWNWGRCGDRLRKGCDSQG